MKEVIDLSQLIFLLIMVGILLILSIFTSKDAIISPQFGFAACFIPGIIYAFNYLKRWNLYLSIQTIEIIIMGIAIFISVSALIGYLSHKFRFQVKKIRFHVENHVEDKCLSESIPAWKIRIVLILEVLSICLVLVFLVKNFGINISVAINTFRIRNRNAMFSDYVSLPGFTRLLRRIALAGGYIVMYLFANGIVYKSKKNRVTEIICIVLAFINGVILGGRGDGIQLIAAGVIIYLLVRRGKNGSISIHINDIIKIIILVAIILATFAELGALLGRQMDFLNFNDYIAVYLSAELKNFDIFIRKGVFGASFKNSQTMMNIVNTMGSLLGHQDWIHSLDNPYHYMGNIALGNVSTIFYAFMYDAGYIGVVVYTALFAVISQIVFQCSLRAQTRQKISFSILFYSYVWYTVIFSFFSDKFYEMIFNTAFIWTLFSWIILGAIFNMRVKVKIN